MNDLHPGAFDPSARPTRVRRTDPAASTAAPASPADPATDPELAAVAAVLALDPYARNRVLAYLHHRFNPTTVQKGHTT